MGNSGSSQSHHRGYSTNSNKGVGKIPPAVAASSLRTVSRRAPPRVTFTADDSQQEQGTVSPGASASLGFTTFLRDNESAVRRMFDGLRQAAAVENAASLGTVVGPIPSDIQASQFCSALSTLGQELGWHASELSSEASQRAKEERGAGRGSAAPPLGQLLPLGGLFRKNKDGTKLISWGEYTQILKMCEAAAAAASGITSDVLDSVRGPRDLVEGLTSDLKPPPPMPSSLLSSPAPPPMPSSPLIPPPPPSAAPPSSPIPPPAATSAASTGFLSPPPPMPPVSTTLPTGPVSSTLDDTGALLHSQISLAEMALAASQPLTAPSTAGLEQTAASYFLPDATSSSTLATTGDSMGGTLSSTMGGHVSPPHLPPPMYPTAGSGASAVRDLLHNTPSRIPVYLPKNLFSGGSSSSSSNASDFGTPNNKVDAAPPQPRPLTDEDIIEAAIRMGGVEGVNGEADDANSNYPSASWGGGESTKGPASGSTSVLEHSTMYKSLSSVLLHYQDSLDVLFNYFAFQQKKKSQMNK